jgi:hypothetical protein
VQVVDGGKGTAYGALVDAAAFGDWTDLLRLVQEPCDRLTGERARTSGSSSSSSSSMQQQQVHYYTMQ